MKAREIWRWVFLLTLLQPGLGLATTLVAIRTPSYVALASDSLTACMGEQTQVAISTCKIQRVKNIFVGAAGMFADTSGFNAYNYVSTAAEQGGNFVEVANRFERIAEEPFTAFVTRLSHENPSKFQKYCKNRYCLQVVMVTVEDGTPKVAMRCFHVTDEPDKGIVVEPASNRDCPGDCDPTSLVEVSLGNHDQVDEISQTQEYWKNKSVVAVMEGLIGAEIQANPDEVGPPIAILAVDANGARWLEGHRGVCDLPGVQ